MATLDSWLNQAVRRLSKDSAETVRREIQEHYEAALEAALAGGNDSQQAERMAVQALGDPCVANRQYRRVLLTSSEAKVLRQSNAESQMFCSNGWTKWVLLSAPGALLLISAIALAIMMALFFIAPFLPIYTATRGRIFRAIKWSLMIGIVALVWGPDSRNWIWLMSCCFYPVLYTEWKRVMIRRKLPISQWPKQLYL